MLTVSSLCSARLHLQLHAACLVAHSQQNFLQGSEIATERIEKAWYILRDVSGPFHWKCAWAEASKFLAKKHVSHTVAKVWVWPRDWRGVGSFQISFHVDWMESEVPKLLLMAPTDLGGWGILSHTWSSSCCSSLLKSHCSQGSSFFCSVTLLVGYCTSVSH